jgi:hypothetical protein
VSPSPRKCRSATRVFLLHDCVYRKPYPGLSSEESAKFSAMIALIWFVLAVLASPFKSKLRLKAENAVLRRQLNVLRRSLHGRVRRTNRDRRFFNQLYRWFPSILTVVTIVQPEPLVQWPGFRRYWR